MKKLIIAIALFAASCNTPTKEELPGTESGETNTVAQDSMPQALATDSMSIAQQPITNKYRFRTIPAAHNTFGYDIYLNGNLTIHQNIIPGLPGNNGFKKEEDAKKVAELVIYKLQNNIMPPSVTSQEMDSVLKK